MTTAEQPLRPFQKGPEHRPARILVHLMGTYWCTPRATSSKRIGPLSQQKARADRASGPASDHIQKRRSPGESCLSPGLFVGLLRTYGKHVRRTAELTSHLALAAASTRVPEKRCLPAQNSLHRSVVKLIIDDYQAGASLYELADRYKVRRNTVRDTLRRAGWVRHKRQGTPDGTLRCPEGRDPRTLCVRHDEARAGDDF